MFLMIIYIILLPRIKGLELYYSNKKLMETLFLQVISINIYDIY